MQVILGGGRQYMLPRDTPDPEYPSETGSRKDGKNLIDEWAKNKIVNLIFYVYIIWFEVWCSNVV